VVCLSVCLSVCHTSEPCKTAERIEMPSGLRTWLGPRDHVGHVQACPTNPVWPDLTDLHRTRPKVPILYNGTPILTPKFAPSQGGSDPPWEGANFGVKKLKKPSRGCWRPEELSTSIQLDVHVEGCREDRRWATCRILACSQSV